MCALCVGKSRHQPLIHSAAQRRFADVLWTVIAAQIARQADQPAKHIDDLSGPDRASHINSQAFPGVLIDHRQAFQLLTIGARIEDKVITSD